MIRSKLSVRLGNKFKYLKLSYLFFIHLAIVSLIIDILLFCKKQNIDVEFYRNEVLAFQLRVDRNLTDGHMVFIGDSHIQGLAVQEIGSKSINYGIGTDTTLGVLNRILMYQSLLRSKAVIFHIGYNDLKFRNDDEIISTYREIISQVPSSQKVFVSALFPIDERVKLRASVSNKRIKRFNSFIRDMAGSFDNVFLIDLHQILQDESGNLSVAYHIGDGVHLNELGNAIVIDKFKEKVNTLQNKVVPGSHAKQ